MITVKQLIAILNLYIRDGKDIPISLSSVDANNNVQEFRFVGHGCVPADEDEDFDILLIEIEPIKE